MSTIPAISQKGPSPIEARLAILDTPLRTHTLSHRDVETTDGSRYRLFIAIPNAPAPETGFAALYMLDGNAAFDTLTAEALAGAPDLAIIGVGYPTSLRFDRPRRSLDYTLEIDGTAPKPTPVAAERKTGGAAHFLERLTGEIRLASEQNIHIDPSRRALWGHSLAGLFSMYALLANPGSFSRFIAVSPSIWWEDEILLHLETKTPALDSPQAEVFVMLGDSERRSSQTGPHWEGPAPHTLELIQRLSRRANTRVSHTLFEGAGHAATLALSVNPTLRFACSAISE